MKKFCKNLLALTIAAAMLVTFGISSFATAESEHISEKHYATLYEPASRESLKLNQLYKMLGNVSNEAAPSVASNEDSVVMAYTDVKNFEQEISKEDDSTSTITSVNYGGMYSVFDKAKKAWSTPKYIGPSTKDNYIINIALETAGDKIYAVCTETEITETPDSIFDFSIPEIKIAIHEFSDELGTFSPVKLLGEEKKILGNAKFIKVDESTVVLSWAAVNTGTITEALLNGTVTIDTYYAAIVNGKWSEAKKVFSYSSEAEGFAEAGIINGQLVFAYTEKNENGTYLVIKDATGAVMGTFAVKPSDIFTASFDFTNANSLFAVVKNSIYAIDIVEKNGTNILSLVDLSPSFEDLENVITTTDDSIFFVSDYDSAQLCELRYNEEENMFKEVYSVAQVETEFFGVDVTPIDSYDMVMTISDSTNEEKDKLSEFEVEYCAANIEFMIYNQSSAKVYDSDADSNAGKNDNNDPVKPDKKHCTIEITYGFMHEGYIRSGLFEYKEETGKAISAEDIIQKTIDELELDSSYTVKNGEVEGTFPEKTEGGSTYKFKVSFSTKDATDEPSEDPKTDGVNKDKTENKRDETLPDTGSSLVLTAVCISLIGASCTGIALAKKKKNNLEE